MDQPAPNTPTEQPVTPAPPALVSTPSKSNGLAITALVLGIIAFLFGWAGFFNLLVAVLAVVFGIIALVKKQHKVFALVGTILGGIGLLTSLIVGVFFTAAIFNSAAEYQNSSSNSSSSISEGVDAASNSDWDVNAAYEKVKTGMTKAEVEQATGKKSESCTSSESSYGKYENCTYGNMLTDNGYLTISYTDDKVSDKLKYQNN